MPYTINKTNGNLQTTINDGQVDTSTSLQLIGKNYSGYGDEIATNFVHLLENFSNASEPTNPMKGQVWYKSDKRALKFYDGNTWQQMSNITSDSTAPGSAAQGDMWWDNVNFQLYGYTGSVWTLIGPAASSALGINGQIAVEITDTLSIKHIVIKEYIGGVLTAVYSKDPTPFTPDPNKPNGTDMVFGFDTINAGINLSTNIGNIQFNGNASNAKKLNNLASTDFLRANVNALTTATLTVQTDSGFIVGDGQDLLLDVTNGKDVRIKNQTSTGNIAVSTTGNGNISFASGTGNVAFTLSGSGQILAPSGYTVTSNDSLTTKSYVDAAVINANAAVASLSLYRNGTNTIIGNIKPETNNTYVLGFADGNISNARVFNNIFSTTFTGDLSGNVSGASTALTGNVSANNAVITNSISGASLTITGNITVTNINAPIGGTYDIGNVNSFRNVNATTFTGTTVNGTTVNATTGNITTVNATTINGSVGSTANITTLSTTTVNTTNANVTTANIANATLTGNLRLNGSSSGFVGLKAPVSSTANITYTLPSTDGSSGQALVTNGSGLMSWAGLPGLNISVFTSGSGTFTIPAGVSKLKVTVVGGGGKGGDGASMSNNGGQYIPLNAACGGSGGYAVAYLSSLTPLNNLTYTVGGAGQSSSVTSGTQIITSIVCGGGGNGTTYYINPQFTVYIPAAGGSGGTATGGTINIPGNKGGGSGGGGTGSGGNCPLGNPGPSGSGEGIPGAAATGFGAGGGGGWGLSSDFYPVAQTGVGGAGAPGIVIFEW